MANFHSQSPGLHQRKNLSAKDELPVCQTEKLERYRAFMTGYVKRINEATFNVAIGGVRIGLAKYSRLAQINLNTRIITFSRFAVENVPERGRRYLVLHELAHVKEASHNKRFWQLVEKFEPDYRQIGKSLEKAFKLNVKEEEKRPGVAIFSPWTEADVALSSESDASTISPANNDLLPTNFACIDEDEILSVLAQEKEREESICQIYDAELDDILDWTC